MVTQVVMEAIFGRTLLRIGFCCHTEGQLLTLDWYFYRVTSRK